MKTTTFLFVSLISLVAGLCYMVFKDINYFSAGLLCMGVLGSMSSAFLLSADKKNNKENSNSPESKNTEKTNLQTNTPSAQSTTINPQIEVKIHEHHQRPNMRHGEEKIFCAYCKCKFSSKFDKCPYCGAPVKNK